MRLSGRKNKKVNNAARLSAGNSTYKLDEMRGLSTRAVSRSVGRCSRDAEGWWAAAGKGNNEG